MSSPRGWPSQTKLDRGRGQHVTIEPIRNQQQGLSVLAHTFVTVIGSDAAEAGSTSSVIVATAHSAVTGDIIFFTSGAFSGREVKVELVDTNSITLCEDLSAAPGIGDTFDILRHKYPTVAADGSLSVSVTEAATAADGGALPALVKVVGGYDGAAVQVIHTNASGDLQVDILSSALPSGAATEAKQDAGNASLASIDSALAGTIDVSVSALPGSVESDISDIKVATESTASSLDVIEGGFGVSGAAIPTEGVALLANNGGNGIVLAATAAGELNVSVTQALPAGNNNIGDVDIASSALPTGASTSALQTTGNTSLATIAGAVSAAKVQVYVITSALPSGAATSALQTTGNTSLSTLAGAVSSAKVQVDVITLPSIPAGTNNIGDVDVLTEPATAASGAAAPAVLKVIGGYDGSLVRRILVSSTGALQVDASAGIYDSNGNPIISFQSGSDFLLGVIDALDVVDFIDTTPVLDTSSTNIPASASNPVQIVSSLAAAVRKIKINDTTGQFIGVYTGAALSEVLQTIIGPGEDGILQVKMNASERVSLRNMANATISTGSLCIQFLG